MAYRSFSDNTGWEKAYESCVYTVEACAANDSVSALAEPLRAHIEEWHAIEHQRRATRRTVVRTNAVARVIDGEKDRGVMSLANDVLHAAQRDTEAPLYKRFFPIAPSAIARLALEVSIKELERVLGVASDVETPLALAEATKPLAVILDRAREAVAARTKATAAQERMSRAMSSWKERANAIRLALNGALIQHAAARGMGRDSVAVYFPVRAKRPAKPAVAPGGNAAGAGDPEQP